MWLGSGLRLFKEYKFMKNQSEEMGNMYLK